MGLGPPWLIFFSGFFEQPFKIVIALLAYGNVLEMA